MSVQAHPTEIAALRARIRDAGEATDRLRMLLGLAGFELIAIALGLGVALTVHPLQLWEVLVAAGGGGAAGYLVRYPLAAGYRCARRRQLRRHLAALPASGRAQLLLSLQNEPVADTRKLIGPFLQELGLPTEAAPAGFEPARGNEGVPPTSDNPAADRGRLADPTPTENGDGRRLRP
jgi:hypothetical protein